MERARAPKPTELEVSLFGRGVGESIAVHLGHNEWIIIDSCLYARGREPAALEYLTLIGVDVASDVKLVLATHFHDDHIRGLARTVMEADAASFACSNALACVEFFELIAANRKLKYVDASSGLQELYDVFEELDRRRANDSTTGPDIWAQAGSELYSRQEPDGVVVKSVSPSASVVTDSRIQLAALLPDVGEPKRRLGAENPNDYSVVVAVVAPNATVLLGADLEVGQNDYRGWRAVVRDQGNNLAKACGFKVPHHGSKTSHHLPVWENLVHESADALLTPFTRQVRPLPTPDDIERIKGLARHVYCTNSQTTARPPKRKGVDRTIRQVTRSHWAAHATAGHVRFRVPLAASGSPASVELFNNAAQL